MKELELGSCPLASFLPSRLSTLLLACLLCARALGQHSQTNQSSSITLCLCKSCLLYDGVLCRVIEELALDWYRPCPGPPILRSLRSFRFGAFSAYRIENGGYIHSAVGRREQPTAAAAEWRNHFNFEIVYPLGLHSTVAVKT